MKEQGVYMIDFSEEAFRERYALSRDRIRDFDSNAGPSAAFFEALKKEEPAGMLSAAAAFPGGLPVLLSAFSREYAALPAFREEGRTESCCILMETAIQLYGALAGGSSPEDAETEVREILYSYLFDYSSLFFGDAARILSESAAAGRAPEAFLTRRMLLRFTLSLLLGKGVPGAFHPEDMAPFFGSRMAARIAESVGALLEREDAVRALRGFISSFGQMEGGPDEAVRDAFTPGQRKKAAELYGRLLALFGPF